MWPHEKRYLNIHGHFGAVHGDCAASGVRMPTRPDGQRCPVEWRVPSNHRRRNDPLRINGAPGNLHSRSYARKYLFDARVASVLG